MATAVRARAAAAAGIGEEEAQTKRYRRAAAGDRHVIRCSTFQKESHTHTSSSLSKLARRSTKADFPNGK